MKRPIIELTEYRNGFTPPLGRDAVAEKLGVKSTTVWRWENGTRTPDRDNVKKIAELVDKPAAQIAGLQ